MSWDPDRYLRFKAERRQPFYDLLAMVEPKPDMLVLDLGCGTGETTRVLHDTLSARHTLGVDLSKEMLAKSGQHAGGGVAFECADLAEVRVSPPRDLVFSNAALHWLDDHEGRLAALAENVAPGGQIAIQIPANHDQPSHLIANEVIREAPFRDIVGRWERVHSVCAPVLYDRWLRQLGFAQRRVQLVIYGHELPNIDAAVDWVRGTALQPYLERLGKQHFERFLEVYLARLSARMGTEEPFYFPYKRILMWGRR